MPSIVDFKETFDEEIVQQIRKIPFFIIEPRKAFCDIFENNPSIKSAGLFSGTMFIVGNSAAASLNLKSLDLTSLAYLGVGTIVLWIIYAIFLHGVVRLFGAKKNVNITIVTYLYVIGFLQPVFVLLLFAVTWVLPGAVSYQEIETIFGGSSAAAVIVSGNILTLNAMVFFRLLSGIIILSYFAIGIHVSHGITLLRSWIASLASFFVFIAIFSIIYLSSYLTGISFPFRIIGG